MKKIEKGYFVRIPGHNRVPDFVIKEIADETLKINEESRVGACYTLRALQHRKRKQPAGRDENHRIAGISGKVHG